MDVLSAATTGDLKNVKATVNAGADLGFRDDVGGMTLTKAAQAGNMELVRLFLDRGSDINAVDKNGWTALMEASCHNHLDIVRLLLDHGAAVDAQGTYQNTALLQATTNDHVDVIRVLLDYGADVSLCRRSDGNTVLMAAAHNGDNDMVNLFVEKGGDIHAKNIDGWTPLIWAAFGDNGLTIGLLLRLGANLRDHSVHGVSALSVAAANGSIVAAQALIELGIPPDIRCFSGVTPLMAAALHGQLAMVHLLLDKGADVNLQAQDGDTALLLAVWKGHRAVVEVLLTHNANTEMAKDDGQTPLMWAAQMGFTDIVRLLLEKNTTVNATNCEGDTALKLAQDNNHSAVVALLSAGSGGTSTKVFSSINDHGYPEEGRILKSGSDSRSDSYPRQQNYRVSHVVSAPNSTSNQESQEGQAIASHSSNYVMIQFTDLFTMCGQMEETCTMCENVLERLQRIQIQANEQPGIVPPNAQADLVSIRVRFHHFLVKYKQRNPFERLVSTRMVISLLREFHERLDAVVAEVSEGDNNLSKWMESWDRDTQEVEASLVRLWKTNPMRILDSLPSQKSQEDALVLLGSETTRKRDSYTADSKTMLRSVKQSIIRLSGASVQAVPDWFLAEHEVQREEQHFALGSFGKVYHGTWYREKVVVKCVNAVTEDEMRAFKREARLWFRAQHPNVVRLFGACHVSQPCFFVCEEAKNGNLVDFLNKSKHVDQALTWRLLHGAALGLQFLHDKKIVHGDLKCNQILVTEEKTAKLTDFGFSFALMESKPSTSTGAVRWKAPELLRSESSAPTFESDVYSFGMCVVEAVSGNVPWGSHLPDQSVIYNLTHGIFISRPKAFVSDEQWEFVGELCAFEPSERADMPTVIETLEKFANYEANIST